MRTKGSPTPERTGRSASAGFTLIELAAVILIIGIMATAAFVSLERLAPRYRIQSEARKLANFVLSVQTDAIRTSRPHTLYYDLERARYWAVPDGTPQGRPESTGVDVHQLPGSIALDRIERTSPPLPLGRRVAIRISARGGIPSHGAHLRETAGIGRSYTIHFSGPGTRPSIEEGDRPLPEIEQMQSGAMEDAHKAYIQAHQ